MEDELRFIERKGGTVLLHNGYQYYKHRIFKNSTRWICSQKKKEKCTGAITVHDGKIEKSCKHAVDCLPDDAKNTIDLTVDEIKAKACSSTDPIPKLYREAMAPLYDLGLDKVSKISYERTKTSIYAKRKKAFEVKKLTYTNVGEVEVPVQFKSFQIADYNDGGIRIIVFCSDDLKLLLDDLEEYYGDGTFQSTPVPFSQLLTLHGNFGSTSNTTNVVPLVYCLMSDRTERSYVILFEMIKAQCPNWEPKIFHCDFETAMSNAIKIVFPKIVIKRCYYHFTNALWRKAKSLGLKSKLYRRIVGLCTALPLLPEEYIRDGWNYIQTECQEFQDMKPFINYFKNYWLKTDEFIKEWCIYNQLHRTNNFAEGWHARLNRAVNKNYVTVAKLLAELEKDVSVNKMTVANAKTGHSQNKRRRIQKERDAFILNAQMKLIHKEITVGHCLEQLR